jgi:hypothetical protein
MVWPSAVNRRIYGQLPRHSRRRSFNSQSATRTAPFQPIGWALPGPLGGGCCRGPISMTILPHDGRAGCRSANAHMPQT